ncbi:MAG: hypothetical protein IPL75_07035 [Acidobacteria bacterium]|nr:hypothetical protein [Acidobacteriota bacterium]
MNHYLLRTFSIALVISSTTAVPAIAQRTTPATQRVEIKQAESEIVVRNHKGEITSGATTKSITVPATLGTATSVVILDPNPLLFTYTWKDVKAEDSKDYTAVLALAKLLKDVGGLAGKVDNLKGGQTETGDIATFDAIAQKLETLRTTEQKVAELDALAASKQQILTFSTGAAAKLRRQELDQANLALRARESEKQTLLNEIAAEFRRMAVESIKKEGASRRTAAVAALTAAGRDDEWLSALATAMSEVSAIAEGVPAILKQAANDPQGAKVAAALLTAKLEQHRNAVDQGYAAAGKALKSVLAAIGDGTADATIAAYVALLRTVEPDARKTIEILTTFQADAQKIGVPVTLGTVPYSATQSQTATVVIAKTKGNPNKETTSEGTYSLTIDPYSRYEVSIAPAYIYSWVKNQPGASGQTLAAVVNFAIRPENSRMLVPALNVGLSPKSTGLDFYLGLSVKVADLFQLGGGLSWTDIKDDGKEYKPGGYLLLSVDLLQTKK